MWKKTIRQYLLIDISRLSDWKYLLLWVALFAFMVIYSVLNSRGIRIDSDFTVFWTAGHNFTSGADLYNRTGGAERYIYPPFAAMLFQLFALVPLKVAASIYTFVNFLLFLLFIGLTREVLRHFINDSKKITTSLVFGVLCSFRFFWYHTQFIQMNELMIILCLASVNASLKNKEWLACALLVLAIFIKILPLFFIPWLVLRGNYKTVLKLIVCVAICLLLPWLWRGWQAGMADIHNYYITFLEPFQNGRVEPEFHNQSLAAVIYKVCIPTTNDPGYNYQLLPLGFEGAALFYKISFLFLGSLLMGFLLWERFILKGNTLRGLAMIIICMHLLSGITWEYHLVSLLFVYAVFTFYYWKKKNLAQKIIFYVLGFFVVLFSFVGKDTVGTTLYHYLEGYGVVTWTMVLLFFFMLLVKLPDEKVIA